MKLKSLLLFGLVLFYFSSNSQVFNKEVTDSEANQNILVGKCTRAGLNFGDFGQHLNYELFNYKPDMKKIGKIKEKIEGLKITIVLGTWCKDSKEQVPRFLKILDKLNFDSKDLTIIGVNSQKIALVMPVDDLNIERVPTFIFYREGEEVGRIIETPKKTLEKSFYKEFK